MGASLFRVRDGAMVAVRGDGLRGGMGRGRESMTVGGFLVVRSRGLNIICILCALGRLS
jgi:hypothetical protein